MRGRYDQHLLYILEQRRGLRACGSDLLQEGRLLPLDRFQMLTAFAHPPLQLQRASVPFRTRHLSLERLTSSLIASVRDSTSLTTILLKSDCTTPNFEHNSLDLSGVNPAKHPQYSNLHWSHRSMYRLSRLFQIVLDSRYISGTFARKYMPLIPVVFFLSLIVTSGTPFLSSESDSLSTNAPPSSDSASDSRLQSRVDSLAQRIGLPKLRVLQSAYLSLPARPPIPDSAARVTSGYGRREDPLNQKPTFHGAVDLSAPRFTPVRAPARGIVDTVSRSARSGLFVRLKHVPLSYMSSFSHLEKTFVQPGDTVAIRDTIALLGSSGRVTGPHLHFRIERDGRTIDPVILYENYIALRDSFRLHSERVQGRFKRLDSTRLGPQGPSDRLLLRLRRKVRPYLFSSVEQSL